MSEMCCLVHYHEIGLKGKNRSHFESLLSKNIAFSLKNVPVRAIKRISGHLVVLFDTDSSDAVYKEAFERIKLIPGVARVSLCYLGAATIDVCKDHALKALHAAGDCKTFKVHAKKSNTSFTMHTLDINRAVGDVLCKAFPHYKVDVHTPEVTVEVHLIEDHSYVWATSVPGVGGLPVGSAGKVISLMSSGFDSPVASWMMGRRGACVVPLHFSGRPETPDDSEYLCERIVEALESEGAIGRLYVIPFGFIQREVALRVPDAYRILMYRRLMFACAERLAALEGAKALVTGESLGQVASQTLENIAAVEEVLNNLPVLRPLIGTDKQEIIERAHRIGTYDISASPAPDCCTLFMPRKPETHASLNKIRKLWDSIEHERMIDDALGSLEYVDFGSCAAYKPPSSAYRYHKTLGPCAL